MRLGFLRLYCVGVAAALCGLGAVGLAERALAEEVPIVRMEVLPDSVLVGESIELRITVLAPSWFPKPPVYPRFELPNAMTRLHADSAYPVSERVGAETWSGIVRSYEIVPLIAATYQLDASSVTVTWADPDTRSPLVREIVLPEARFRAVVPAGAEALDPFLTGRMLTITREIEEGPETQSREFSVGDAIVVHYVAELDGMAAVFLPPLFLNPRAEGAAVYASEARIEEGDVARRIETLTFVLDQSGEFILPGVEMDWWDTTTNTIETASIQELSVRVRGAPLSIGSPGQKGVGVLVGMLLAGIGLSVVAARRWLPELQARHRVSVERRLHSEAHAFGALVRSLRLGEAAAIHRGLLAWLGRLQPGLDLRGFVLSYGDSVLGQGIEGVIATVYAESGGGHFDAVILEAGLRAARKKHMRCRVASTVRDLSPLNP